MTRAVPLLAAASLVALAACSKQAAEHPAAREASVASAPAAADASGETAGSKPAAAAESAADVRQRSDHPVVVRPPATPTMPQLAMAYRLGFVLPAEQVRPLMESHQEACELAGPLQCQVLGASSSAEGRDKARAELTLRATPAWMRAFRTRAEADAKDAGGKVDQAGTVGEDLSQSIVDTEAAQRARAAELERLHELMDRQTRDLDDTLQVEQEITRVQGEIDQAASQLAMMQNRIAMQTVTIGYRSKALVAPVGVTAPIAEASEDFASTMAMVFAALIRVAAVLTPFAIIGAPIVWLVRRRKPAKPAVTPTP
jgi:hypothetical protein